VNFPASTIHHWWRPFAAGTLGLLVFVACLPTLVGTRWIYEPLIARLSANQFQLQIEQVHIRWLSPLKFSGIRMRAEDGPTLLTIADVETDRGLLGYLLGGRRLGRITINQPTINVRLLTDGSDMDRLIQSLDPANQPSNSTAPKKPAIDVQVQVHQLSATVTREDQREPLVIIPPLDLDVTYRAADGDSHLAVAPTTILDHVAITPELIEMGLGHAIPLLAQSAWFDGQVSLAIGQIDVPLDEPAKSLGQAQLTLHHVRSGPSDPGVIRLLLVDLAQEQVSHSGLRVGLPTIDERLQLATAGSVGLVDRALNMTIDVPIPLEQLARRESVQQLGVQMVRLPIGGTLDHPEIRWDALRGDAGELLGLIKQQILTEAPGTANLVGALEGLAEGQADQALSATLDFVQQLRQRRQAKPGATVPNTTDSPTATDAQAPSRESLRDRLRKRLLGGSQSTTPPSPPDASPQ
jgi:hypothetical protein